MKFKLTQISGESYLFINYKEIIIFFFINNIAPMSTVAREKNLEDIINKLKQKFKITNLSKIKWFLNIKIIRDRLNRKIQLYKEYI